MAIGWLTVIKAVPWGEVIANAPKIANAAKKLLGSVSKKTEEMSPVLVDPLQEGAGLGEMQAHLKALEAETVSLRDQMLASSELIKNLAEQNAQLVQRIESNRAKLIWLTVAVVILGLALAVHYWNGVS